MPDLKGGKAHKTVSTWRCRGRCLDNAKMERFWWALKSENIHLNDYKTLPQLRLGVQSYVNVYNAVRLHSAVGYCPPDEVYHQSCRMKIKPYSKAESLH